MALYIRVEKGVAEVAVGPSGSVMADGETLKFIPCLDDAMRMQRVEMENELLKQQIVGIRKLLNGVV